MATITLQQLRAANADPEMTSPQESLHLPGEITTYAEVRDRLDDTPAAEPDDDAAVVILSGWVADNGDAEITYPHAADGAEAAREYVDTGDWGEITQTKWIDVRVWRVGYLLDAEGDVVQITLDKDQHTITLEPEVPECDGEHDHDWRSPYSVLGGLKENPGVWGHGGGLIIKEVCEHCGGYRVTDTWAQDRETAERFESREYRDADDSSLAYVARRLRG